MTAILKNPVLTTTKQTVYALGVPVNMENVPIVYNKVLPKNKTINRDKYTYILFRLNDKVHIQLVNKSKLRYTNK